MVQWARHMIDTGRVPLDGWFPNLGLGFAQFHHYSSLPHIISAYLSKVVGVESADHPTDGEIVARAKASFAASDRMR